MLHTTISYYNSNASEYNERTFNLLPEDQLITFMTHLPSGKILDIGCGSGRDTVYFQKQDRAVDLIEPSLEMSKIAFQNTGIQPQQITVQKLCAVNEYAGVWACASLLHVPEEQLSDVITKIYHALQQNGVFYCSFKKGTGTIIDEQGRLQTHMTLSSLSKLCCAFKPIRLWITKDSNTGRCEWVNIICKKEIM